MCKLQIISKSVTPKFTQNIHLYTYIYRSCNRRIMKLLIEKKKSYLLGMTSCIIIFYSSDTSSRWSEACQMNWRRILLMNLLNRRQRFNSDESCLTLKDTNVIIQGGLNNRNTHNSTRINKIFHFSYIPRFSSRELFLDSVRYCQNAQNAYRSSTCLSSAMVDVL